MKTIKIKLFSFLLLKNKIFPRVFLASYQKTIFCLYSVLKRNMKLFFIIKNINQFFVHFGSHVFVNAAFIKLFNQVKLPLIKNWAPGFLTNKHKNNLIFKNSTFIFYSVASECTAGIREAIKTSSFFIQFQAFLPQTQPKSTEYCVFYNAQSLRAVWFSKSTIDSFFKQVKTRTL